MSVDQHRQHAQGFVILDKTHSTHICREIINNIRTRDSLLARLLLLKIQTEIFHSWKDLVPFLHRFNVDGADLFMPLPQKIGDQMATDKTAAAANYDSACAHELLL